MTRAIDLIGTPDAKSEGMRTRLLIAIAAAVSVASPVLAAEPTEVLRKRVDRVVQLLSQPGNHRAEIRQVAEEVFDFEEMSRRALGPHWNARTPEERGEFVRLFTDLLERTYVGRVESARGGKVLYGGDTIDGNEATVRTRLVTPQRTEIPLDYRMHRKNGRWQIYDVNVEGISLVNNYRSQFNTVIQSSSYAALVERLRSKEPDPAASAAPPSPRRSRRD
jgi:phospholipid transport system substrate-binding protein